MTKKHVDITKLKPGERAGVPAVKGSEHDLEKYERVLNELRRQDGLQGSVKATLTGGVVIFTVSD